ncbi:MAG TPA: DUF58 domain-containing protein [Acidimicrobiales bacterium]|nr:DUF58 domain-containing protein [Acidimicrobiales bacterium]
MNGDLHLVPRAPARPEQVLRSLELAVTRRLDGLLQGDHQGFVPGAGGERGDARLYEPGDDVRRVDWPLTARLGTPHVRDTVADRELETWVLVDGSASMEFGTSTCRKRDLAVTAVAAVGFLTARYGNRTGVVLLGGERPTTIPARPGRQALLALLHALASRPPTPEGRRAELAFGIRALLNPPRRRGLAVVVSDFLCPSPWPGALRSLATRHQVLAVEVIDPRELELPSVGCLTLVDPETGRHRDVQTSSTRLRSRYAAAAAAQRVANATGIRRAGAAHLVLRTDRDWLRDTVAFVASERRRRAPCSRA